MLARLNKSNVQMFITDANQKQAHRACTAHMMPHNFHTLVVDDDVDGESNLQAVAR
jgi:hypothetical protein